ncbi:hypothetical protein CspeluHIS016_0107310 [Cutaneotrichosporon spelunceum]|uniref:Sugar phosphate transporter domain-containing protein n=1 Tax=Cutaneotrichosporon spelunceum TaxID=1672016 RepID=A0AAD3TPT8_9TREE|nr:hypothetical protein CspeluHIS016_0107310 [Cutaneotrichosporon spelunceum]
MADIRAAPLGHKNSNSIGLDFSGSDSIHSTINVPSTVDLSDDMPIHPTFSPRQNKSAAYTTSAEPPNLVHPRGHLPRAQTVRGLIPGTPPEPTSELPTRHERKGSPAYSDSPYADTNPLTRPNGILAYPMEDQTPRSTGFIGSTPYWLGMYFFFNLGLTLFNKVVLVSFPFAYTLTGLHALSACAGCYIALERGAFTPARLTQKENLILAAFSVLYTINIAVSNISLQLVTVPFHQVVRAATPLFTIFITAVFLRQKISAMKIVSLLPVVAGVGLATYGDYYFTTWGLILTLLGTFLAALKTVVTNLIQTGVGGRLKLHPLDLLIRMSPLAFVQCVFYSWYTGELERVRRYGATQMTRTKAVALLINGIIACGLNIVSFTANKKAGALTMTVSANCKQVLTIALAVVLFNLHITIANGIGICLTLAGGAWYAFVEFKEKQRGKTPKL